MDQIAASRKRPAPAYNDFSTAKRQQSNMTNNNIMFLSDDEADAQIDEELFGRSDNDNDFHELVSTLGPVQPQAQDRTRLSRRRPPQPQQQAAAAAEARARSNTVHGNLRGPAQSSLTVNQSNGSGNNTTTRAPPSTPSSTTCIPTSASAKATFANPDLVEVKEDPDTPTAPSWLNSTPVADRIELYVGKSNKVVLVKRSDLSKSPTLTSYITDDPSHGSYIMRPQLLNTNFADFDAVLQFLHSDEYAPMLIENPEDKTGPRLLDGMKTTQHYARELVRSGRIYLLAQAFQVEGMADMVYNKISKVDSTKFPNGALVELASVIFNNKRVVTTSVTTGSADTNESVAAPNGTNGHVTSSADGATGPAVNGHADKLEQWTIDALAKNFQEIMQSEQVAFWQMERKTSKKMLYAKVLEEVADRYRTSGGKLPGVVVELD